MGPREKNTYRFNSRYLSLICLILFGLAACSGEPPPVTGRTVVEVWAHSGQAAERVVITDQVARFNQVQDGIEVRLTSIPERSYNAQVQAAALAGDLPDLLEFDGPFLYNYAWQGHLRPLDEWVDADLRADLLPSILIQGSYQGRLFSLGTFDSGLGLYGRRSRLLAAGLRIPTTSEEAWSAIEFEQALKALAGLDEDGAVLDLKLNYPPEWFTYAFSPLLQSAGGDLIDRSRYHTAQGVLNGPAAVAAMQHWQGWIRRGYVDPNIDDGAFVSGRVALSWVGHWEYHRYAEALGNDLVLLPLPNMGRGSRTGQGSWNWGIAQRSAHPLEAMQFLRFLLRPEEVLKMADANGAVPATRSAIAQSAFYGEGGPLRLFADQLSGNHAVPRPQTPAYPVITSVFHRALQDIRHGAAVAPALDRAAADIDQDIADNRGYPVIERGQ